MGDILIPLEFDRKYSYRRAKEGEFYIVGAERVEHAKGFLFADLSLDKITSREHVRVWTPRITNPFASRKERRVITQREFFLENQILDVDFRLFFRQMNRGLREKYCGEISFKDAKLFFRKLHNYYSNIKYQLHPEDRSANLKDRPNNPRVE